LEGRGKPQPTFSFYLSSFFDPYKEKPPSDWRLFHLVSNKFQFIEQIVVGADAHIGPHTAVRIRRNVLQICNIALPGRCGHRPLQGANDNLIQLDKSEFEDAPLPSGGAMEAPPVADEAT